MSNIDDANREIEIYMLKHTGLPGTPELKKQILEDVSEILHDNKVKDVKASFNKNSLHLEYEKINLMDKCRAVFVIISSILILFYIFFIHKVIGIYIIGFLIIGYISNKWVKRSLDEINAEKFGMDLETYRGFEKKIDGEIKEDVK